ncbi:MAG: hypothetical protein LBQ01_01430, partial [Prevotellaceae bacterium]|nr:hypothetical protein [Prevotellaceae bacterium]
EIYGRALRHEDYEQAVRAVIHRVMAQEKMEKSSVKTVFDSLQQDAKRLPQPAKSVVYSITGDVLMKYYNNNHWKIMNRTHTDTGDDVETWDITRLYEEIIKYYRLSVHEEKLLQQTPFDKYNLIFEQSILINRHYTSTLYDWLALRAINAFSNLWRHRNPQDAFVPDDPEYFAGVHTFVNCKTVTDDTLSAEYQAIRLYQELLKFQIQPGQSPKALVSVDMERLKYIHNAGNYNDRDARYENALKTLMNEYEGRNEWCYIAYDLAIFYQNNLAKSREAHDLCTRIISKATGEHITGSAQILQKEIENPSAGITLTSTQYPDTPILASVKYRNMDTLHLWFFSISDDYMSKSRSSVKAKDFTGKKPFATQTAVLPSQNDYREHITEIIINRLPQGLYAIFASNMPDLYDSVSRRHVIASTTVQVSPLAVVMRTGNEKMFTENSDSDDLLIQLYVADSRSGKPVENAQIEYIRKDSKVERYTAGNNGIAYIRHNMYPQKITVTKNRDRHTLFYLHTHFYSGEEEKPQQTVFFTDRSIYRPGQTVYYKALCLTRRDGNADKPLTGISVDVEFRDANNKTVATQKLTTGDYGTVQGSFAIPQNLLNGMMSLRTEYGQHYIQVAEYKRPTFEVKFDPLKGAYRLNDSIHVSGTVKGFANYNVDNARVQYRIVRHLQYRLFRWWYPVIPRATRQISSGTLNTDGAGKFVIGFKAEAENLEYSDLIYTYEIVAEATDANGETRGANLSVKTGKIPLLIKTSLPENIISGNPAIFDLTTTNLNGNFVPADISVTVTALKSPERTLRDRLWEKPDTFTISRSEFEKHFPADIYDEDNRPEKFADEKQIISYQTKTADIKSPVRREDSLRFNKLSLEALSGAQSGWYRIDIKAKSADSIESDDVRYVYLLSKTNPAHLRDMNNWVTPTANSSAEPGENVEFMVAGGEQKSYIYYDIILNNRVTEQKSIVAGNIPKPVIIPVKEEYRGGFTVQFVMVQNNRTYTNIQHINVPYSNRQLDIKFTTFRDELLPGEHEKWSLTVKNRNGEKEAAEMVATLYDASLDAFTRHSWSGIFQSIYRQRFVFTGWQMPYQAINTARMYKWPVYEFEFSESSPLSEVAVVAFGARKSEQVVHAIKSEHTIPFFVRGLNQSLEMEVVGEEDVSIQPKSSQPNIVPRRNFSETAFFYPQLRTDEHGEIRIEFTVPESLTRWKMLGFAHTEDLKAGDITNELITRKKVMITANAPRFFREDDLIDFTAKINSISDSSLAGQAVLHLYDACSMQPVDTEIIQTSGTQDFTVKAHESTVVKWRLKIPEGVQAITYRVTAQADSHSDGEEKTVPVMLNSTMVTETMPFSIRAGQQKEFVFDRLRDSHSKVLRNHRLTLEFTSSPAWYAVQSIPYMMEYPYECAEQTFARFYANSLASTVINSSPRIRQIFDAWRDLPENSEALLSNLEKNQELKQVLLEETPWVMQAQNETERKKRTALLFDLNRMKNEQQKAVGKLIKMQLNDGGFPWFDGLQASRFITQHIVAGLEHLKKLNALNDDFANSTGDIISKGLKYLDSRIIDDYGRLKENRNINLEDQHIGYEQLHYLYTCSFSKHRPDNEAFKYYYGQAGKYWTEFNIYARAMTSLVMKRFGDSETAAKIIRSLKEHAVQSEETGMYWNSNVAGYFWYQAPIETQAMLIEAFSEVTGDKQAVEEMKIWLLRNRQTNSWKTTKATTEACYALLSTGDNLLDSNGIIDIEIAGKHLAEIAKEEIRPEPGTGYVKTAWNGSDISTGMAVLKVKNPNSSGIAWGGMYWQYFESLDRITDSETNLKLKKQLFLKRITAKGAELSPVNGKNPLKVGDAVVVRMELRADRDYEYVHLKDMRAAGFEPVKTLSGHRYQDGLRYYENIKDASNNFFIPYLRKGTYVFEYELRV